MFVRRFNYLSYILPPNQRPTMLSYRDIVWAYHSESQVRNHTSMQAHVLVLGFVSIITDSAHTNYLGFALGLLFNFSEEPHDMVRS